MPPSNDPPSLPASIVPPPENTLHPHDSFDSLDSDASSRDPLHGSIHPDTPKDQKTSRRVYFDYDGNTSDSLSPIPLKSEDGQDAQPHRHSSLQHSITPSSYSFPWELPAPAHARTPRRESLDKESRVDSPSFFQSQPFWLVLYFAFNLGLTLYNKAVLIHFPYAYALTALHALCGSIGGFTLLRLGVYVPAKLTDGDNLALLAFSFLYTINIAVSNLSLELVTIPVSPSVVTFYSLC